MNFFMMNDDDIILSHLLYIIIIMRSSRYIFTTYFSHSFDRSMNNIKIYFPNFDKIETYNIYFLI